MFRASSKTALFRSRSDDESATLLLEISSATAMARKASSKPADSTANLGFLFLKDISDSFEEPHASPTESFKSKGD